MQVVKQRKEPVRLTLLQLLEKRADLSYEDRQSLINLKKGFDGEKQFDLLAKKYMTGQGVMLQDLSLTVKGSQTQVDAMLLNADCVYLYEIKNYEGSFVMKDGTLYTRASQEISNPLTQLNRTACLIRQLLQNWQVKLKVEAYVVFINPDFIMYHARPTDPYLFHSQIRAHFDEIPHGFSSDAREISKASQLARKLLEEHGKEGQLIFRRPPYAYAKLKKGITCPVCGSFDVQLTQRTARCLLCSHLTTPDEIVLKMIEEFSLLFPDRKITVSGIDEWCKERISKKRILRILTKYYTKTSLSVGTHYVKALSVEERVNPDR